MSTFKTYQVSPAQYKFMKDNWKSIEHYISVGEGGCYFIKDYALEYIHKYYVGLRDTVDQIRKDDEMPVITNIDLTRYKSYESALRVILNGTSDPVQVATNALLPNEIDRLRFENERLKEKLALVDQTNANPNTCGVNKLPETVAELRPMAFGMYSKLGYDTSNDTAMRFRISQILARPIYSRKTLTDADWKSVIRNFKAEGVRRGIEL